MSKANMVHPPEMLEADRVVRNFLQFNNTIGKVADKIRYFKDGITRRDQNVCGELKKLYDSLTSSKEYGFWNHWTLTRRKEAESVLEIIQQDNLIEQCNKILAAASPSAPAAAPAARPAPAPAAAPAVPAAAPTPAPTASAVSRDEATTFAAIAQRAASLEGQGPEHYKEAIPLYMQVGKYLISQPSENDKMEGKRYVEHVERLIEILEEQDRQRLEGNAGGGKRKRKRKQTRKTHKLKRSKHKHSKYKKSYKRKKTLKRKYKKISKRR